MAVGQVSFHRHDKVKRGELVQKPSFLPDASCEVHVAARENPIVNRLNKTKVEREVDHEAEKTLRLQEEASKRRAEMAAKVCLYHPHKFHCNTHSQNVLQRKAELELTQKREAQEMARSYDYA